LGFSQIKTEIESELRDYKKRGTKIDFITFAGNGEPTCYPAFFDVAKFVVEMRDTLFPGIPTAIFTNGTNLVKENIRKALGLLDEVMVKMDAGDQATLQRINRPFNKISLNSISDALVKLGKFRLSTAFIFSGRHSNIQSLKSESFVSFIRAVKPIEVQLYTIDYPPYLKGVRRKHVLDYLLKRMISFAWWVTEQIDIPVGIYLTREPYPYSLTQKPSVGRRRKVLIVDDIQDYLHSLENALKSDFDCILAQSLESAKKSMDVSVSAALVDIRLDENDLENKDGILLLKWLRQNYPDLPVVMMSAYKEFDYAVECLNLGAVKYLKKPIDISELKTLLHQVAEGGVESSEQV